METHLRSVIKAVSWRVIATLTTMALVFAFTGKVELALAVGGIEMAAKLLFYYLHERSWNAIKWGKAPQRS